MRAFTLLAAVVLTGCGAVMHGGHQNLFIASTPQGAKVETSPLSGMYTTPAMLTLERKHEYILTLSKEGFTPATVNIRHDIGGGTLVADVILGIAPLIIDAVTGSWYGLTPENTNVTLTRPGQSELDLDAIHIALSTNQSTGHVDIRADKPVRVSLKLKEK